VRRSKSTDFLPPKKDFIQAKYDFIDQMLRFGQFPDNPVELVAQRAAAVDNTAPAVDRNSTSSISDVPSLADSTPQKVKILDVGCGIGGTTRYAVCSTTCNMSLQSPHVPATGT
jgi:2-polyprenyl-3-methyl-5-hydroxy-6-metoxy-1,4-benzoquinol methylase